eukprot:TRINITY_DN111549_c0_g1_i1.p1 TRINITY_DN111549_c0_g1~~TRINITY_DN111549_c0_g1_i1.p1  ORF type:complete len:300 (+),score=33.24 TRINITY_DN111549_c0_g1_i1:85-984(+)
MLRVFASATLPAIMAGTDNAIEISSGVWMPVINLGGVSSMPSNYSSWLEIGGRGVDTALMYGPEIQRQVGSAVLTSGVSRKDLFVTSKVPCDPYRPQFSTGNFTKDVDATFHQLGLPYVDLMLMHNACRQNGKIETQKVVEAYRVLESLVKTGRARAIGVSNFDAADLKALLPHVTVVPAVNQCKFSIGMHDDVTQQFCQEKKITYSAYSPLGGLSHVDVMHDPDVLQVASAHNKSWAQVALRWVVQQGVVAVTSTDKVSHQHGDLNIFDFKLTDDEMTRLRTIGSTAQSAREDVAVVV